MSTVRGVMTSQVVAVTEDAGYREVLEALVDHHVSALPVTDAEGRVVGVVSEEDLLHKEEFKGGDYVPPPRARLRAHLGVGGAARDKARATSAAELMTRPAVTVGPDNSVVEAARLMERRGVKHLPVVDGEKRLVGIVSRSDLLRVFLRGDSDIADEVRGEIAEVMNRARDEDPTATVTDGVVHLTGTVRLRSEAQELVRRAQRVEGVVSVDSSVDWHVDDIVPEHVRWRSVTP
ncbi:CBS domain-containing protein [Nocardiopsis sp. EMB25]|uniref:CBS domain-containing protein n=1 Tax=Nocardiopsis TaxID=2013 RepID=UPI00034A2F58|nr:MULTISPECIES: CBS domain-containing protein [Nocardiopsis]MCY9787456.1 CBS domain-containing protein [Nocardiopsis sp. EMB25]